MRIRFECQGYENVVCEDVMGISRILLHVQGSRAVEADGPET